MEFKKLSNEIKLAIEAATKAGKKIMEIYQTDFSVANKADKSPVTSADLASNKIIQEILKVTNYPILSEESLDDSDRLNQDKVWIIDPLDGTSDFIDKTGEFSVMIALVDKHQPVVGVVYQPVGDLLYVAVKGEGAYQLQNNVWQKLAVTSQADLTKLKVVTSRHHLSGQEKDFLEALAVKNFRPQGSCGLKVTEICAGKADLYFTTTNKIRHWDTAPAYCLLVEAGGKMTDIFGEDFVYNTKVTNHPNGLLATNGQIHQQIVDKYKDFLKK